MKKICLVIPSLQAGGMERVMTELIKNFVERQALEIHLVLYGITREIFFEVPSSVIIHKPEFEFNNQRRFFSTIKTLGFLRRKIKEIKPDSILSFGEYWNNFVLLAAYGLKYPVYVSDRCQPDKSLGKFHDKLRKILYPGAAGIVAQTRKAREIYKTLYNHDNIAVIGNPVREIKKKEGSKKSEKIVLNVGRLIHSKHQDELIRLFASINKEGWKLIIVGYDHLKQNNSVRLKKLIRDLDVEHSVILAGKQDDVDSFYLKSSIFAFTSSSEGFPNVIGEAMSSGLPVVSFDCVAGPADMIEDGKNGFLIPLFDYSRFRERLSLLMEDQELRSRMGKQAEKDIKQFEPELVCNQFFEFICGQI